MPEPLAVCIEDLEACSPGTRYLRCVAVPGRQPGLRVDRAGEVLWKSDAGIACERWVSGDDKLILFRPEGAERVVVGRGGRSLDVPAGKPVVLLDQDRVDVGGRRLRVHLHGTAPAVGAPSYLPLPVGRGFGRAAATALALGAALGAADCGKKPAEAQQDKKPAEAQQDATEPPPAVEVRVSPPAAPILQEPPVPSADAGAPAPMTPNRK